jgi:hypothetical protein
MHGTVPAARAPPAEAVPRSRQRTNLRQASSPNHEVRNYILAARDVENSVMKRRSISFRGPPAVFWFRTSRTDVSRHAGLMSAEIPD